MMKPCKHLSPLKPWSEFQPMRLEQLFVVTRDPPSGTTNDIERHRTTFAATAHVTRHDVCRAAECGPLPLKLWRVPGKQKAARNCREWKKHLKKTKGSENLRYLFFFWLLHLRISRFVSRTLNQLLRLLTVWGCLQNINRNDPNPNKTFLKFCISKSTA